MLMNEFGFRFVAKDEQSFLFEVLRRVGRLERKTVTAATEGWLVWETDPVSPPVSSEIPSAGAARA